VPPHTFLAVIMSPARSGLLTALLLCGCGGAPPTPESAVPAVSSGISASEAAPVPDRDALAPPARQGISLDPSVVHPFGAALGSGFLPGSTFRNREDTPSTRGPGLELRVPVPGP
jgi:hypothetical protein